MRGAASDLRRQDANQASTRASRALDKLRELERQLQAGTPDGRRRALGDLQLEARQLADAERQIAEESRRAEAGDAGKDTLRRLAGDQERLVDRLRRVQEGLAQQGAQGARSTTTGSERAAGGAGGAGGAGERDATRLQQAAGDAARDLERQRLADRMRQSADAMRAAAEPRARNETAPLRETSSSQEDIARALDRLADRLSVADRSENADSRRLSDQLSRAKELRERLDDVARQLGDLDRPSNASQDGRQAAQPEGRTAQPGPRSASGDAGRSGRGQGGSGGTSQDVDQLRADLQREMERVRDLLRETDREHGTQARGGAGFTFEGQGMTLSAPGTEAFKQDFAKWQELKRQATAALEQVESALARQLLERDAKERLASGLDDQAPAAYQDQVDSYFKALATEKQRQ